MFKVNNKETKTTERYYIIVLNQSIKDKISEDGFEIHYLTASALRFIPNTFYIYFSITHSERIFKLLVFLLETKT